MLRRRGPRQDETTHVLRNLLFQQLCGTESQRHSVKGNPLEGEAKDSPAHWRNKVTKRECERRSVGGTVTKRECERRSVGGTVTNTECKRRPVGTCQAARLGSVTIPPTPQLGTVTF